MTIPPVGIIEMALESVKDNGELKELRALGVSRLAQYAAKTPKLASFERGYLLGLETARASLQTMPVAIQAGVTL